MLKRIYQTDPEFNKYLKPGKIFNLTNTYDYEMDCAILTGLVEIEESKKD